MSHRKRGTICLLLLAAQALTACGQWHVVEVSPKAFVDSLHPSKIRVLEKNGAGYVLHSPAIIGDTLTGMVRGVPIAFAGPVKDVSRRVALTSVDRMAVRKADPVASVLLVLFGGGAALLALFAAAYGGSSN